MKVLCIDNDFFQEVPSGEKFDSLPIIPIGTICTIIDEADYSGLHFYRFAEYLHSQGIFLWWYDSRSFIPISDIDETQMERNITNLNETNFNNRG